MLPFLSTAVATSKSENRNPCNNFGVAVEDELSPPQIFELGGYNIRGSRNQLLVLIYTGGQLTPSLSGYWHTYTATVSARPQPCLLLGTLISRKMGKHVGVQPRRSAPILPDSTATDN